ncbi:uncharacterized protein ACMZJ9_007390 [Mantella aurantiaca]
MFGKRCEVLLPRPPGSVQLGKTEGQDFLPKLGKRKGNSERGRPEDRKNPRSDQEEEAEADLRDGQGEENRRPRPPLPGSRQPGSGRQPPPPLKLAPPLRSQPGFRQSADGLPTLEPWMKQTVVLKLKEVDGRIPDLTPEIFGKKCILDQGFTKAETLSVQSFVKGVFYITFMSLHICQRYWEKVKAAGPDSIFGKFLANSPIQREERRVTVSMQNPHTPGKDINTFLQRFCTVVKEPSRIPDANCFWTGKWTAVCRLRRYPSGDLQHLPPCFSLGSSAGILHYADQPQTCRRCGKIGHVGRNCSEPACRYCRVAGHETKDCPRSKTCNLCGLADDVYRDCPQRARTYAGALIRGRLTVTGETETAETTARKARQKINGAGRERLPNPQPIRTPRPTIAAEKSDQDEEIQVDTDGSDDENDQLSATEEAEEEELQLRLRDEIAVLELVLYELEGDEPTAETVEGSTPSQEM